MAVSRPVPNVREYVRQETYLGRFVMSNMFGLCWIERMLQIEQDKTNRIFDWVVRKFFTNPIYQTVSERPDLYR